MPTGAGTGHTEEKKTAAGCLYLRTFCWRPEKVANYGGIPLANAPHDFLPNAEIQEVPWQGPKRHTGGRTTHQRPTLGATLAQTPHRLTEKNVNVAEPHCNVAATAPRTIE